MSELKPTDIPKGWLEEQYATYPIGNITRHIEQGKAPISDDPPESVSRTNVARAMCVYGLFPEEERYKQESWLRSLYQENTAVDGYARIDDLVDITEQQDEIAEISSATIGSWFETYDIPTGKQTTTHEVPRTDEFDRAYFFERYREDELTLRELTEEVNAKTADSVSIHTHKLRDYLRWLDIEIRDGGSSVEFEPVENVDQYVFDHHYRARPVQDAAPVDLTSWRHTKDWMEVNDDLTHWVGRWMLPEAPILYDAAELADKYKPHEERTQWPIRHLANEIDVAPAAVELALVFHGIRDELTFAAIDDPDVVENADVPRGRSDLLTDRGAFAVLRLTFGMDVTEVADYLNVCEGLVQFAERVHDLPVETPVGRPSDGVRGQLHDPRYIEWKLTKMSIPELAAEHNYESTTPVEALLEAFELYRPTTIPVPELDCSVKSHPEKHIGTLLAALAAAHPEITVSYETEKIQLDISEFACSKDTKQYEIDFTIETDQKTYHIEVKGGVDNGKLYEHVITDRQKAKAMMDAISDCDDEEYIVITNGAELKHYDYEFSFADGFDPQAPIDSQTSVLADKEALLSILRT